MIRKALPEDIDSIMVIIRDAQRALAELGIDQWQDGYPTRAIVLTGEEAYRQIDASQWNTSSDYVVVHRLCVRNDVRRRGTATELMQYAITKAKEANFNGFRIDTHKGNIRMLSLLERLGFKHTGRIHYDSGEREAFDLNI